MLIGLMGYARAGKDSIAAEVQRLRPNYEAVSFADPLREFAVNLNPFLGTASLADILWTTGGWEGVKSSPAGPAVRAFLQDLGLTARDVLGPDVWVHAARLHLYKNAVIPDVRFENEVTAIRKHRGKVALINRPGTGPANGHVSETDAISKTVPDVIITNDRSPADAAMDLLRYLGQ